MRWSGPVAGGSEDVWARARCNGRGRRAQADIKAKEDAEDKEKADKAQADADKEAGAGGRTLASRIAGLFDLPQARARGARRRNRVQRAYRLWGLEPLLLRQVCG